MKSWMLIVFIGKGTTEASLMKKDCVFCKFSKDKKLKVWESRFFYGFFDLHPVSPGHTLIISKRHVAEIGGLNENEWEDLRGATAAVIRLIETTDFKVLYKERLKDPLSEISAWFCQKAFSHPRINTKPDGYNHGVNDGKAAGRTLDHFHWHLVPRYKGDMSDPTGGVRYVIPQMGNYKKSRGQDF